MGTEAPRWSPAAPARYAVIGQPVRHSLSPRIHRAFAEATGQVIRYGYLEAPRDGFAETVDAFLAGGGCGLNVTLPFKEEAAEHADALTTRAAEACAVNTLSVEHGRLVGDNTDGAGLVNDLTGNLGLDLAGKDIVIVGAGGAVRGILGPLAYTGAARIHVVNRTAERAQTLVAAARQRLGRVPGSLPELTAGGLDARQAPADLVINATAAGHDGGLPALPTAPFHAHTCVYDLSYGRAARGFLDWAATLGVARTIDGLGMLVEQAALSFERWRGVRPPTEPILTALRDA